MIVCLVECWILTITQWTRAFGVDQPRRRYRLSIRCSNFVHMTSMQHSSTAKPFHGTNAFYSVKKLHLWNCNVKKNCSILSDAPERMIVFFLSRCVLVSVNRACFLVGENTNNRMHFAVCEMHVFCVSLSLSLVHCAHAFVWLRRNNTANLIFITNETNLHSVFLFCLFVYFCNFASAIIHTRVELHTFSVYVLIFSSPICCMRTDGNPLAIVWFLLQK